MFEWALHSGTRKGMLKLFFKAVTKPLYGLEIAQALKASPGTTHRELNAMLKIGIIVKKKEGVLVKYRLNTSHPYFHELKKELFPMKRDNRVLLVSGLKLSTRSPSDLIDDFSLFLDYADEHGGEFVFVGDTVDALRGDVFQSFLLHQSLFERVNQLAHDVPVTVIPGTTDAAFKTFIHRALFDSHIRFEEEYWNPHFELYVTHSERDDAMGKKLLEDKKAAYVVLGNGGKAHFKEYSYGVYFNPGAWSQDKTRHFVEIDEEGGALVSINDLR